MSKVFHYGGQALIEGVMMRGQRSLAIAVRCPSGELDVAIKPLTGIHIGKIRRVPLVRGIIVLVETLVLGIQSLLYSANVSLEEEGEKLSGPMMWGVCILSLSFAVALFFIAPLFLVSLIDPYLDSSPLSNIVEGIIRIVIFVLYLGGVNLVPSTRRVFAYHGAEHKVVNAYEDGAPLEVTATRRYSTAHTRCGTNFLLVILIIAILVFALVDSPEMWLRILSRIALIPVIAALGYEVIQLGATYADNRVVRAFLTPGLALQILTTRQPNDSQLEVAIFALKGVVEADAREEVS